MLKVTREYQEAIPLTTVKKLVDKHKALIYRYDRLKRMYDNENEIKHREVSEGNPNNKLSHGFAEYIVNTSVGYFMGRKPDYKLPEEYSAEVLDVLNYNDEQDVNTSLATSCSIYGCGAELFYLDKDGEIRFRDVDIREIIYIVSPDIEGEIHTLIRHWDYHDDVDDVDKTYIEIYDQYKVVKYSFQGEQYSGEAVTEANMFNMVPFVPYINNDRLRGDFEGVVDLINAYDQAQSDTANDFEAFTDCYLEVVGAELDPEAAMRLKELKVFNFPAPGGSIRYVTKDINDTATENYKDRLVNDIHKLSGVPDMTDENFAGVASGVALKYKLLGLEYQCSVKEAKFKKGLLRRIEIIASILKIKKNDDTNVIKDTQITFVRNTVDNVNEMINQALMLKGLVSDQTILEMLGNIIDVEAEKERLEEQRQYYIDQFQLEPEVGEEDDEQEQQ